MTKKLLNQLIAVCDELTSSLERVLLLFTSAGMIVLIIAYPRKRELDQYTSVTTRVPDTTVSVALITHRTIAVAKYVQREARREAIKLDGNTPTTPANELPRENGHILNGVPSSQLQGAFWKAHGETAYRRASTVSAFWAGVFNVPEEWIWQVWWIESRFDHTAVNPGSKCAGLQQIAPTTATWIGVDYNSITRSVFESIDASDRWYRKLYDLWTSAGSPTFNTFGEFYGTQLSPTKLKTYVNVRSNESAVICHCAKSNKLFRYGGRGYITVGDVNRALLERTGLIPYNR